MSAYEDLLSIVENLEKKDEPWCIERMNVASAILTEGFTDLNARCAVTNLHMNETLWDKIKDRVKEDEYKEQGECELGEVMRQVQHLRRMILNLRKQAVNKGQNNAVDYLDMAMDSIRDAKKSLLTIEIDEETDKEDNASQEAVEASPAYRPASPSYTAASPGKGPLTPKTTTNDDEPGSPNKKRTWAEAIEEATQPLSTDVAA